MNRPLIKKSVIRSIATPRLLEVLENLKILLSLVEEELRNRVYLLREQADEIAYVVGDEE